MPAKSMIHLNGALLCAVDVETTGTKPGYHEVWQVCFLPLDNNLEPSPHHSVFDILVRPDFLERVEPDAIRRCRDRFDGAKRSGLPYEASVDLFERWFESLKLAENKRIIPLAHGWPFDRGFLKEWMGELHFDRYIDARYRDTMVMANWINDRADFSGEAIPFVGERALTLGAVCRILGIDTSMLTLHDALHDCIATAKAWKEMVKGHYE